MMIKKLVSIGLPTYNRAKDLPRALDLLLAQTYRDIEIIVSDNCSTDDTKKICEKYVKQDPRIRYIRQRENMGQQLNFQFVINEARGQYFMLAADDDWWDSSLVATLKSILDHNPGYGAAMCSFENVYEDGTKGSVARFVGENDVTALDSYELFYRTLLPGRKVYFFIYGLFRSEVIKKFMQRPFPRCVRFDHIVMAEIALSTRFYSIPEVLFKKTIYRASVASRYAHDLVGEPYQKIRIFRYLKYLYWIVRFIATSSVISRSQKLRALLLVYPRVIKDGRGIMFYNTFYFSFPKTYQFFRKILKGY